jgi:hypothetical protein
VKHWTRVAPANLTESELHRLPRTAMIAWCVYCKRSDYAFTPGGKAWEEYELQCPHCQHTQILVPMVLDTTKPPLEPE